MYVYICVFRVATHLNDAHGHQLALEQVNVAVEKHGAALPVAALDLEQGKGIQDKHSQPTCWIGIHVFMWSSHMNTNGVFHLLYPVCDMNMYIFKVNVFTKYAKYG